MTTKILDEFIEITKKSGQCPHNHAVLKMLSDKQSNPTRQVMIGTEIYRSRKIKKTDKIGQTTNFWGFDIAGSGVNPNIDDIQPMRANRARQQVLYCADVNYLALIEVRPQLGESISLATLKSVDFLEMLDLSLYHIPEDMPNEKIELFRQLSLLFSKPVDPSEHPEDYYPTQVIAEFVKELGYDGLAYSSSLSPRLNKENYSCSNFAIFNFDKCVPIRSNVILYAKKPFEAQDDYIPGCFEQIDKDQKRINLIGYREKDVYDFTHLLKSQQSKNGLNKNAFVSIHKNIYTMPIRLIRTSTEGKLYIGDSLEWSFNLKTRKSTGPSFRINFISINTVMNDLRFLFDALNSRSFWIGDRENPRRQEISMALTEEQYKTFGIDDYSRLFNSAKAIKYSLLKEGYLDDFRIVKHIDTSNVKIFPKRYARLITEYDIVQFDFLEKTMCVLASKKT